MSSDGGLFWLIIAFIVTGFCLIYYGTSYTDFLSNYGDCNNEVEDISNCSFERRKCYDEEVEEIILSGDYEEEDV